ncbi:MAG: energy-coupling factor ABC transporter substrate-binding protein [Methanosarcinaceae archaeon]|nr:energy-coupling factor ABC transporter substrate-binding protein [Methanosarcinaceae archaeon]
MKYKAELIFLAILLVFTGQFLYVSSHTDAEYTGSDGQGGDMVFELTGGTYELIAEPLWEPPSGEIETLLFTIQACIGTVIIGYFLGYYKGKGQSGN